MEGSLKGLFGGGESTGDKAKAQDFIKRVTTGDPTQGYDDDEANEAVQTVIRNAPRETIDRAMQQSMGNLNDNQRAEFSQMLQQRTAQGRPATQASQGSNQGGGIDDILGGLLGGGSGGGIGDLLGGLLGGGDSGQSNQTQRGGSQGGGLGDIMSNPIGRAALAGMAAFAMREILDR